MDNILKFPEATIVNKVVPKKALYEHAAPDNRSYIKDVLTLNFDTIRWMYKLTGETLNVADGEQVHEIDVFVCTLKRDRYSLNGLCGIDGLIPRHTMFIIQHGEHFDILIQHKQRQTDGKWKRDGSELQSYLKPEECHLRLEGQNMDAIYTSLLSQVSQMEVHSDEEYLIKAQLREKAQFAEKKIRALENKIRKEKQFNRQLEINQELKLMKQYLDEINEKINNIE